MKFLQILAFFALGIVLPSSLWAWPRLPPMPAKIESNAHVSLQLLKRARVTLGFYLARYQTPTLLGKFYRLPDGQLLPVKLIAPLDVTLSEWVQAWQEFNQKEKDNVFSDRELRSGNAVLESKFNLISVAFELLQEYFIEDPLVEHFRGYENRYDIRPYTLAVVREIHPSIRKNIHFQSQRLQERLQTLLGVKLGIYTREAHGLDAENIKLEVASLHQSLQYFGRLFRSAERDLYELRGEVDAHGAVLKHLKSAFQIFADQRLHEDLKSELFLISLHMVARSPALRILVNQHLGQQQLPLIEDVEAQILRRKWWHLVWPLAIGVGASGFGLLDPVLAAPSAALIAQQHQKKRLKKTAQDAVLERTAGVLFKVYGSFLENMFREYVGALHQAKLRSLLLKSPDFFGVFEKACVYILEGAPSQKQHGL